MSAVDTINVTAHERLDRIEAIMVTAHERADQTMAIMADIEKLLELIGERLDQAGKEGDQ